MELLKPPKNLILEGNLSENWRKFKQNFDIYLMATGQDVKDSKVKAAILLNVLGEEAVELYNTFQITLTEGQEYETVVASFENYTKQRKNIVIERYVFNSRSQGESEPFNHFVSDLKKLVATCEFEEQTNSIIRDRIVLGVADKALQEKLLRIADLDMEKAIEHCRAAELSKAQLLILHDKKEINAVKIKKQEKREQRESKNAESVMNKMGEKFLCRSCNTMHYWRSCPAFGKSCLSCGRLHHFAVACRLRKIKHVRTDRPVEEEEDTDGDEFLVINAVTTDKYKTSRWFEKILVENKLIEFKLDTGCDDNVLPVNLLQGMSYNNKIRKTNVILESWGGQRTKPIGEIELQCQGKTGKVLQKFIIVENTNNKNRPLLSAEACELLGYVKRLFSVKSQNNRKEEFIRNNITVFSGQGTFEGKVEIKINEGVQPIAKPPRRIAIALEGKLKETLAKLEKSKIISKEDKPMGWVNNLVIVQKPDKTLRICLDPKELNKIVKKEKVLIPTIEELTSKLTKKKLFTVLDLKDGFWHMELTKKSSKLCTFSTPYGCYRFNRLPFGLTSAPELFQKTNQNNFSDIKGVAVYFDDLLVAGENEEEHDRILKQVIERAKKLNIKFNPNKVQYKLNEVKYLGHIFGKEGNKPDPDRVRAIQELEIPKNKKELQKILGMAEYLRRFTPSMAEITAPLRELLRKDKIWLWMPIHEEALNKLKTTISQAPVLRNYDRKEKLIIQADASMSGLGCCLLQGGQPISFGSRRLTDTEKAYAQVEKEMLGVVFALQKFHYYVYGHEVKVLTDHKPLVALMNKEIGKVGSPRLQRMRLKLLRYNVQLEYLPGKEMLLADLLSRSFIKDKVQDDPEMVEIVHSVSSKTQISDQRLTKLKVATEKDAILQELKVKIEQGWGQSNKMPQELKAYYVMRNSLAYIDGLIYSDQKIVIPESQRQCIIKQMHASHCGITKIKARARQIMYWPGITRDIEKYVQNCRACEKYAKANITEPMIKHERPKTPFEKVGVDIFEWKGEQYLALMDYYSRWLEIKELENKKSSSVIRALKSIFVVHGIPQIVIADNMPFNSYECHCFARAWNFEIRTSSPNYPKSNGLAEKAVGIAKGILRKCAEMGQDSREAIMEYRNTPVAGTDMSPSQLLMSRRTRTKVPIGSTLLKPQIIKIVELEEDRAKRMKFYYDQGTRPRSDFKGGESVVIRKDNKWEPGEVIKPYQTPRSYLVRDDRGTILRRNSNHLKHSNHKLVVRDDIQLGNKSSGEEISVNEGAGGNGEQSEEKVCSENEGKESEGSGYTTRYGRKVERPNWLKDYEE